MTDNVSRADVVAALRLTCGCEETAGCAVCDHYAAAIRTLPAAPAAAAPLLTPAPTVEVDEWVLDVRVGMAAVYRGPRRNCLSGISCDQDCVFVARGAWINGAWVIDDDDRARALRCYAALRGRGEEVVVAEGPVDYIGRSVYMMVDGGAHTETEFHRNAAEVIRALVEDGQRVQVIVRKTGDGE